MNFILLQLEHSKCLWRTALSTSKRSIEQWTSLCVHTVRSLYSTVWTTANQSYANSAYIQMQAGFLHQARSILACTAYKHKMSIYVCVHIKLYVYILHYMFTCYAICVHITLYVYMLHYMCTCWISFFCTEMLTMSKFTCIESHVAMSVRCLHVSVAQEGSAGCRWPKTSELHTYRCAPTGEWIIKRPHES